MIVNIDVKLRRSWNLHYIYNLVFNLLSALTPLRHRTSIYVVFLISYMLPEPLSKRRGFGCIINSRMDVNSNGQKQNRGLNFSKQHFTFMDIKFTNTVEAVIFANFASQNLAKISTSSSCLFIVMKTSEEIVKLSEFLHLAQNRKNICTRK